MPFIYLASQSPRRSQLLAQIGVAHRLLLPLPTELDAAEQLEAEQPGEAPRDYVVRVTGLKLQAARQRAQARGLEAAPILCADTTVALDAQILGKPADAEAARTMLVQLSGQNHDVFTAVAVEHQGQVRQALSRSRVQCARLDAAAIGRYVHSGQWQGKAGGYGIQGLAATFVQQISGSYSGIMGLPLFETAQLLEAFGYPVGHDLLQTSAPVEAA